MNSSISWPFSHKSFSKDLLLSCMISMAKFLQDLAREQRWSYWESGKEWRKRLDGPALINVPTGEQEDYLARKLDFCSIIFDFEKSPRDESEIIIKEATLEDICDFISTSGTAVSGSMQVDIMDMVARNIFRVFPPVFPPAETGGEDISDYLDPAWPHLSLVYQAALKVLERPDFDPGSLKKVINKQYLANLFALFASPDARERDYLKTILHRIYGNFLNLRGYIRSSISSIFLTLINEKTVMYGISELLEVMGAVIKGLAVPLKPEHFQLMQKILIPLYSAAGYLNFSGQLEYCIVQLVLKDPKLSIPTIRGLLKYWPLTEAAREVQILSQMEELIGVIHKEQFQSVQEELFHKIGKSVMSQHFQVAERALQMWGNKIFKGHIRDNMTVAMPILLPYIFSCRQNHWNEKVIDLSETVLEVMDHIDQQYVD